MPAARALAIHPSLAIFCTLPARPVTRLAMMELSDSAHPPSTLRKTQPNLIHTTVRRCNTRHFGLYSALTTGRLAMMELSDSAHPPASLPLRAAYSATLLLSLSQGADDASAPPGNAESHR
ncbi:hypothetical protein T484DRAFT_1745252 [Baffinella frigidus]|nr:hypothetical protein T484DRAFT_1745252 [Cryptophyta sp. CCMP2293]